MFFYFFFVFLAKSAKNAYDFLRFSLRYEEKTVADRKTDNRNRIHFFSFTSLRMCSPSLPKRFTERYPASRFSHWQFRFERIATTVVDHRRT